MSKWLPAGLVFLLSTFSLTAAPRGGGSGGHSSVGHSSGGASFGSSRGSSGGGFRSGGYGGGYSGGRGFYGGRGYYGGFGYRGWGYPYAFGFGLGLGWGYPYYGWGYPYYGSYGYGYGYDSYPAYSYAPAVYSEPNTYQSAGYQSAAAPTQPVVINQTYASAAPARPRQDPPPGRDASGHLTSPPTYLIAFPDGSVTLAVAYWTDGGTLHYVTRDKAQKQVAIASIDRPLTEQLNRERHIEFHL